MPISLHAKDEGSVSPRPDVFPQSSAVDAVFRAFAADIRPLPDPDELPHSFPPPQAGEETGRDALAVDAAHAEIFDLEEFLDAVFRAFAADAALLHAAERGDLGRDDALVDADDAVFEPLGDAPDAADVAAVE